MCILALIEGTLSVKVQSDLKYFGQQHFRESKGSILLYSFVFCFIGAYFVSCMTLQCCDGICIVLYSILQYGIALYYIAIVCYLQYTLWYHLALHKIVLFGILLHGIVWGCMELHVFALYQMVLYCVVDIILMLNCIVISSFKRHCMALIDFAW